MLRSRSRKFWKGRGRESEILERSESGIGNFGKVGVGVGYYTSDSATLLKTSKQELNFWCKPRNYKSSKQRSQQESLNKDSSWCLVLSQNKKRCYRQLKHKIFSLTKLGCYVRFVESDPKFYFVSKSLETKISVFRKRIDDFTAWIQPTT